VVDDGGAQARRRPGEPLPLSGHAGSRAERAFGCVDALERTARDLHDAPRLDAARHDPPAELLLVVFPLLIAEEQPRDGGVAPVHDAQALLEPGRLADAQVQVPVRALEPHVPEVGRARVDLLGARPAQLAEQGRLATPIVIDPVQVLLLLAVQDHLAKPVEIGDHGCLGAVSRRSGARELLRDTGE
jgi:hypothetical protein